VWSILTTKQLGNWGEDLCLRYLARKGFRLWEQNWRCRLGELDIVARKDRELIFIEVKSANLTRSVKDLMVVKSGAPNHNQGSSRGLDFDFPLPLLEGKLNSEKYEKISKLADIYRADNVIRIRRERVQCYSVALLCVRFKTFCYFPYYNISSHYDL
jgi:Uncharacterised protein family UPF0102